MTEEYVPIAEARLAHALATRLALTTPSQSVIVGP